MAKTCSTPRRTRLDTRIRTMTRCSWLSASFSYMPTGIPEVADDPGLHQFWAAKLAVMGTRSVKTYSRGLRYRERTLTCPHGTEFSVRSREEKGIDVRIALDSIRLARKGIIDVA